MISILCEHIQMRCTLPAYGPVMRPASISVTPFNLICSFIDNITLTSMGDIITDLLGGDKFIEQQHILPGYLTNRTILYIVRSSSPCEVLVHTQAQIMVMEQSSKSGDTSHA